MKKYLIILCVFLLSCHSQRLAQWKLKRLERNFPQLFETKIQKDTIVSIDSVYVVTEKYSIDTIIQFDTIKKERLVYLKDRNLEIMVNILRDSLIKVNAKVIPDTFLIYQNDTIFIEKQNKYILENKYINNNIILIIFILLFLLVIIIGIKIIKK